MCKLKGRTKLLDVVVGRENNFGYEETQVNDNKVKQVVEYQFPITYEINCLYNVFAFALETCNVENSKFCDSYAAGVCHLKNWFECFNGDLNND